MFDLDSVIEEVAKTLCESSNQTWRTGTYTVASGKNFETEEHNADSLNNHWRYKAKAVLKRIKELNDTTRT